MRKILCYIVYGDKQDYYDGAIFSFLTFMNWVDDTEDLEVVVLAEKPEKFKGYPMKVLLLDENQKREWSIGGKYDFRIKNRGLAYVFDELKLSGMDKILFFDTDTYFHKSPMQLFDLIKSNQALMYLNEGKIYKRKRFSPYISGLENKKIQVDSDFYELSINSAIWGSLLVGISANMRQSLDWADKLMLKFYDMVHVHTIEEFSLSETLLRKYKLVEGKRFVSLYSTSRKKAYAKKILTAFFRDNKSKSLNEQIYLAQRTKIKRPIFLVLKQRFLRIFDK